MDTRPEPAELNHARLHQLEPIFELGGPAYRVMQRVGAIREGYAIGTEGGRLLIGVIT